MIITTDTRIALLSTRGRSPLFVTASATANNLHILTTESPGSTLSGIQAFLTQRRPLLSKNNVSLFVDAPSGMLNHDGHAVGLGDANSQGESRLNAIIDRVRALQGAQGITYPKNARFELPADQFNQRTNDKGQPVYQVDWSKLSDEARALLLVIDCAYHQTVNHHNYWTVLFGTIDNAGSPPDALASFTANYVNP
jgi:hypothetical protein